MKFFSTTLPLFSLFLVSFAFSFAEEISTKGALIIASVEGQVTVLNNETQKPLDGSKVIAGGVIYDGHTVKTGPSSKMVLLLTNGTIATIKSDSSLNIKKFTQEKFDMSKTNLSELKGEPSKSNVVIDIEIGDMVVDVKKLDKQSSFNIESPVGTAGIRGTVPAISVVQMPDGGFQQKTAMLRGEIAFTPRGGGLPTLLGPGQSLASGIGPNGVMLPMQLGQVSPAMMSAIQADLEAAGEAMGIKMDSGPDGSDAAVPEADEPSEDELNESDDDRKGASKGLGDDNGTKEAVALDKAGLIDLNDPEQVAKSDSFVEVTKLSAKSLADKSTKESEIAAKEAQIEADKEELATLKSRLSRRNSDGDVTSLQEQIDAIESKIVAGEQEVESTLSELGKDTDSFVEALTGNLIDVVDVTIEMDALGIKDPALIEKTAENAEKAPATKSNVEKAKEVGVEDSGAYTGILSNPETAEETAAVFNSIEQSGEGNENIDLTQAISDVAVNADISVEMKAVTDQLDDSTDTTSLFTNIADAGKIVKKAKDSGQLGDDIAKNVAGNADVIVEMKAVADQSDETTDNANLFANIGDAGNIVKKAKDSGQTGDDIAKSVAGNADVIVEMRAVVDQSDDTTDNANLFANIGDAGNIVKKAKDSGQSGDDIARSVAGNADVIVEMRAVADQSDDTTDNTNLFANIGDAGNIVKKAKDSGQSVDDIAKSVAGNADVIVEMRAVVDQSDDTTDNTNLFANIGDAGNIVKKAKDSGQSGDDIAKSVAGNADVITEMRAASDQLDELGAEGDASSFFTNISDVGRAVKNAKDLGVDDDELIKNMARNPNQASKVNQAFEELGADVDADGAKNLLGNVEQIDDTLTAIGHAKQSGANLKEFVKKDVAEHKALNNVVEKLGDSADKFLEEGIEDALQLNQAIEDGHVDADTLANSVSSGQSFADAFKNSSAAKLNERFAGNDDFLEAVSLYEDQAKDILFALSFVDPGSSQEVALMGNLDKLGAIMYLSHRFEDNPQRMNIIYSNLDVAIALDQLVAELGVFPGRLEIVFQNAELAPSILATYQEYELTGAYDLIDVMFSSSQNLRDTISNDGLNKLLRDYPQFALEIENNREQAGEINNLITQVGQQFAPQIFENLDNFDDMHVMVLRTKGDPTRIETLFLHIDGLVEIRQISDHYKNTNVLGGQDVIFSNLELFAQDQAYYEIAFESPKYFVRLSEIAGDLREVPSGLALQLKELELNREELKTVLNDLLSGPQVDGPTSSPPEQDGNQVGADTSTLSFLLDHVIPSQDDENIEGEVYLNPSKVVSYETASSSSFFSESADLYFMLSDLETTNDYQSTADTGSLLDAGYFVGGVFGGRNIEFNSATYNLGNLASENLLVAASGKLSLNGEIDIIAKSVEGSTAELIFMSLERLSIQDGSSVKYQGDSLGFGSLESIDIINVDLFAEGEISLRSLDNLVINNSDMATSGNGGADFVHLLAASELSIDNLRFSEHVRQITMEAMTINLSNLNFPAGSTVQLNSLYGGVDGKYPTFGGKEYGRVNFIQNVRYNQNLMNSRSTFDQFGGAITIGSIK